MLSPDTGNHSGQQFAFLLKRLLFFSLVCSVSRMGIPFVMICFRSAQAAQEASKYGKVHKVVVAKVHNALRALSLCVFGFV